MKHHIEQLLQDALRKLPSAEQIPAEFKILVERTKDQAHGDFATNIAMSLAKTLRKQPRQLAEEIVANLPTSPHVAKTSIAGPGFINFHLTDAALLQVIPAVLSQQQAYGHSQIGKDIKVLLEFVSSNPTGPLHVGHGRQAAFGASVANLLEAAGYQVHREYYLNDAGRQMAIIAVSVWLRYLEIQGEQYAFPSNAYQGDYVKDVAKSLQALYGDRFFIKTAPLFQDLPADAKADGTGDKEAHIDALGARAKEMLGTEKYNEIADFVLKNIVDDMRNDLEEFGVTFDTWYSERSLTTDHAIDLAIEKLKKAGFTYEKEGALWFCSSQFGDEKDRVLIRSNGQATYFAPDVAYHHTKFARGYDLAIDVLGADHHGYVPRIRASIAALQGDPNKLEVALIQFVSLYRGSEKLPMSTRSGSFVTLRELRKEVGNDAARFFYIYRKNEQHLDFDLELAVAHSNNNPVYYIQYAHARICSVFRQLEEKALTWDKDAGLTALAHLQAPQENALLTSLAHYPEVVEAAALNRDPHMMAHYLTELANHFHTYYNAQQFIVEDAALRNARLCLIVATRQVLCNGLNLLGISQPESM